MFLNTGKQPVGVHCVQCQVVVEIIVYEAVKRNQLDLEPVSIHIINARLFFVPSLPKQM